MDKTRPFDDYFNDPHLTPAQRIRMQLTRQLVHELYPDVTEQTHYAMPGFYPKGATKATQQLFLLMANAKWLGIYGTQGLTAADLREFTTYGVTAGKGSLHVPYDMPKPPFKRLLQLIITHNTKRHKIKP